MIKLIKELIGFGEIPLFFLLFFNLIPFKLSRRGRRRKRKNEYGNVKAIKSPWTIAHAPYVA